MPGAGIATPSSATWTTVRERRAAGQPGSRDTKKKELVRIPKRGRQWRPAGNPNRQHPPLPDEELGKTVPYGVYDLAADAGSVSISADHDTTAFAVAGIRRWWQEAARAATGARTSC